MSTLSNNLVAAVYPNTAAEFTSTTPVSMSAFDLVIDPSISENWVFEWKLGFSYSNETTAPTFFVDAGSSFTIPSGASLQQYLDVDYGDGWVSVWAGDTWIGGGAELAPYPSASNVYHVVTLTLIVTGYTGSSSYTTSPTVKVAASGDICRVLAGAGTSTSF